MVDPSFDWGEDRLLGHRWSETVIYETHVKGFTMRHPGVPEDQRGTYAGLASEAAIEYLNGLGVTAVELLPVHHIADESFLVDMGLSNYWGYSSIGYLAPHSAYSSSGTRGEQLAEFKAMVKALHAAGIEVIMDVVYNHTAEGNHLGPMLSFKGIDNASYYRLSPEDPRYYMDFTGTGNSLNHVNPNVLQLMMDSLRYFVLECHVDGFRFDLASTLARELYDVDRLSGFFDVIHQDPILNGVKLIAEPWDVGPGGYQVGNFPILWTEWNGAYRDSIRDFWRGETRRRRVRPPLHRLLGPLRVRRPRPAASINFVTAHDGFTLRDLVSYNEKHNEANLEDNQDGADDNRSWNCGVEGETDDPEIIALRARQQRNFLATLLLSQGVPMLLGGDEFGRSQQGNNNAWCQDNELSWFDWDNVDAGPAGLRPRGHRAAPPRAGLPPTRLLRRRRGDVGAARRHVAATRRRRDDRGGLGTRGRPRARRVPQRSGDPHPRSGGQPDRGRLVPHGLQRPSRPDRLHGRRGARRPLGHRPGHGGRRRAATHAAGDTVSIEARSMRVLRRR